MSKYVLRRKDGIVSEYDYIGYYSEGFAVVGYNGKWGYIDKDGKEICPLQYVLPLGQENNPFSFSEGYAVVVRSIQNPTGGNSVVYGYINTKGIEECPCRFDLASNFNNGIALVKEKEKKWSVINKKFEIITERCYDEIRTFINGFAAVRIEDKWGGIDMNGKEICKFKTRINSDEIYPLT